MDGFTTGNPTIEGSASSTFYSAPWNDDSNTLAPPTSASRDKSSMTIPYPPNHDMERNPPLPNVEQQQPSLCPDWDDLPERRKFSTAEQAQEYKQSRKILSPTKPDRTILRVVKGKAAFVEELYEAITNVDEMQDKPGATYDLFTKKKSGYESAFIFAVCWRLILEAIVYNRDGFRKPISQELKKHMGSFPEDLTCEMRLEAACEVFRREKTACVDVLDGYLSDDIKNDFLINPRAYGQYKADEREPPGKRRRGRTTRSAEIPISIYPEVDLLDHLQYDTDGNAANLHCKEMVDQKRGPINLNDTTVAEVEAGELAWIKRIYAAIVDDRSVQEERGKLDYMISTDLTLEDFNECDVQVIAYQILGVAIDGAVYGIIRNRGGKTNTGRKTTHTTNLTLKGLLEAICARLRLERAACIHAFTLDGPKIIEIAHDVAECLQNPNNTKSGGNQTNEEQGPDGNAGRSNKNGSPSKQTNGNAGDQPSQSGRSRRRAEPSATKLDITTNTPDDRQTPADNNNIAIDVNTIGDSQMPIIRSSIDIKTSVGNQELDRGYPAGIANTLRRKPEPGPTPISAACPSRASYYTSLSKLPDPYQLSAGALTTPGNRVTTNDVERRHRKPGAQSEHLLPTRHRSDSGTPKALPVAQPSYLPDAKTVKRP